MDSAVVCKLFASLCFWSYILIECSNGIPFAGFLSPAERFSREIANDEIEGNEQRIREEDLRKLILKKLRFRDLEDMSYPKDYVDISKLYDLSGETAAEKDKRSSNLNHAFVNKVAALLNGLKPRDTKGPSVNSPKIRMSSLRFGRK